MDITERIKTGISLCTGMRGLERGVERAGVKMRIITYVEIESIICENMVQQMEQGVLDEAPIWSNLKTFNGKPFRGMVDIITGGFPCQPFSVAGLQLGKADPRHLWPYIGKGDESIVGTVRPICCFFENVPGLLNIGYREVRSDLEQLGYTVEEGIFSAEEVGAPHQRKRLFILAIRKELVGDPTSSDAWAYSRKNGEEQFGRSSSLDHTCRFGSKSKHEVSARRNGIEYASETGVGQANSCSARNEAGISESEQREERQSEIFNNNCDRTEWPAGPNQEQYDWEASRVESSVGYAINGYNFREDLLRMAGNGVVEQTAELAVRTLMKKHGL